MSSQLTEDFTRYVNPLQGTYSDPSFSRGNTLPIVSLPFGMTHWSAQTRTGDGWFFDPKTPELIGVRATHQPSPWMADYGHFTVMAQIGETKIAPSERALAYRPEELTVLPHYLSVLLGERQVQIEMTPSERCSFFRFTFPHGEASRVIFDAHSQVEIDPSRLLVTGFSRLNSGGVPRNFACYFAAQFDQPWTEAFPTRDSIRDENETRMKGEKIGAVAEFAPLSSPLLLRVGTSFISADQALRNLQNELGDRSFDDVRAEGEAIWNETLGRIEIGGGTEDQRTIFYSGMYRAHLFPRMFHEPDVQGKIVHYSPFDGEVHDGVLYTDNGFWDTYRTVYSLLSLVQPARVGEIIQGFLNAYKEGGWLPNWPSPGYRSCMIGTHIDVVIADAVVKNIPGFDYELAYEAMCKHAETPIDGEHGYGRIALREYLELGYVPADKYNHATARTLDYAYDDFCLAQVAGALGKTEDQAKYQARALFYRNVYDTKTGFMRGRNSDGSWQEPFDDYAWGDPFIEGSAWQFLFTVPHDPAGLIDLLGGASETVARLDEFLYQPPTFHVGTYGGVIHEMAEMAAVDFGQYDQGNQPVHQFLYLYAAAGSPWKADYWIRRVLNQLYTPDHFPGDEDNGEMAAWYVLNALGLGPLCPGVPEYILGSPLFPSATIHLEDGKTLTLDAPDNADFVQQVWWNGVAHSSLTVGHALLAEGGILKFDQAETPPLRQIAAGDLPYALSVWPSALYNSGPAGPVIRINCGGDAVDGFVGDAFFAGGEAGPSEAVGSADIPEAVYRTQRSGTFSYILPLPALSEGRAYTLHQHFIGKSEETLVHPGPDGSVTLAFKDAEICGIEVWIG